MTIKLIAIDLDGTLLNENRQISQADFEALHYAHKKGAKIVLCTGRPYLAMKDFVEQIGLNTKDDFVITYNGGQVHAANDGSVVVGHTLSKKDVLEWYYQLKSIGLPISIIDQTTIYEPIADHTTVKSDYIERTSTNLPSEVLDFNQIHDDHVFNKFVVSTSPEILDSKIALIEERLLQSYSVFKSRPFLLEIVAKGVNKGNTLKELGQKLNIQPSEMMAIGDQENDLSMINLAGVGVAMGNAIPKVKKQADFVTLDNENAGVCFAIHHFLG